jgi:hypothetical protein
MTKLMINLPEILEKRFKLIYCDEKHTCILQYLLEQPIVYFIFYLFLLWNNSLKLTNLENCKNHEMRWSYLGASTDHLRSSSTSKAGKSPYDLFFVGAM